MDDERAGPPPNGGPAPEHEPQHDSRATASAAPAADPRTTIAGRYAVDLQAPPDDAGISVVYRGRDLRTRDPVVVKTLRLEYRGDPDMRARFRREARLLQFLSHPNVVRALTYAEERGAPWLVLESVQGRSLREEIDHRAPLSPEAIVPLLRGLAAGLDHLHARGLVHLDVRPDNAVVGLDGEVKLTDFGLAQAADSAQATADGIDPNDVAYLAPEQVCGELLSAATDVYALGCIVYEMLTGRPPIVPNDAAASRNDAIRARLEQAAVPPSLVRGDGALPVWVDDVVLGALERSPRQRYGSPGSFAAMFLSGVEGDVDVETRRPRGQASAASRRQIPTNEPGIAMKGSPRLATRRGEHEPGKRVESDPAIVDAAYSPLATSMASADRASFGGRGPDLDRLGQRLWQGVLLAAALNLLLIVALIVTRGELPGVWERGEPLGPGATVQIAGTGLVARAAPETASAIVAELPAGGTVRISGEPVSGDEGPWWPIEVETPTGMVNGYVPESWVQLP